MIKNTMSQNARKLIFEDLNFSNFPGKDDLGPFFKGPFFSSPYLEHISRKLNPLPTPGSIHYHSSFIL